VLLPVSDPARQSRSANLSEVIVSRLSLAMVPVNELCAIALQTDKEVMAYDLNVELVSTVITGLVCRTLLKGDKQSEKDHHDAVG